jgi:hypothetical protein
VRVRIIGSTAATLAGAMTMLAATFSGLPVALADSCWETATVNIDCTTKSPRAAPQTPAAKQEAAKQATEKLRKQISDKLNEAGNKEIAARNEKTARIVGLADGAVNQQYRGDNRAARTLYNAALREAGDDPDLVDEIRRYVERGTGVPLATWYDDQPAATAAPAQPLPAPAQAAEPVERPFTMDAQETEAEIRRLIASIDDDEASAPPDSLSPECQALVQNYVAAARVNDGPGAAAGLNALMKAGGCGVVAQAAPAGQDPRFQSRGDTPMLDQTVVPCDQQPENCAASVSQLEAGISPAAVAAMYSNAIGIGLELGGMMGQGVLAAQQMNARPQPNMNSRGTGPVRNTSGPGGPSTPAPARPIAVAPCRLGGAGWCTAQ